MSLSNAQAVELVLCDQSTLNEQQKQELLELVTLDLSGTQICSLEVVGDLTNLEELYLQGTKITSLEGLKKLKRLRTLDLRGVRLGSLETLRPLKKNLTRLFLSEATFESIPQWLVCDTELPFYTNESFGTARGVYMKDARLSKQPIEIFKDSRDSIKKYYQEEQTSVDEAKVIFLGDGDVGKTHTIHRIRNGEEPDETRTTRGIEITRFPRPGKKTINFWDFGGQDILRAMHHQFLSEGACYVITASNHWQGTTMDQARKWLQYVKSFASNSPVILALNRWENVEFDDVNANELQKEFPDLVIVKYTAKNPRNKKDFDNLIENIEEQIKNLPYPRASFPKSWIEVMEELCRLLNDQNTRYIEKDVYRRICEKKGVGKNTSLYLLRLFNDLGVCFSKSRDDKDGSELPSCKILNPVWFTNAVYRILNECRTTSEERGRVAHKDAHKKLGKAPNEDDQDLRYDEDELKLIWTIMRELHLSAEFKRGIEFVPALFPIQEPNDFRPQDNNKFVACCEERYDDYLPDGVLHRLMIELHKIAALDYAKCWLKGLNSVEDGAGLRAVCEKVKDKAILRIEVYQDGDKETSEHKTFLRTLLDQIGKINEDFNLKSKLWVCSEDGKDSFPLSSLLRALQKNQEVVHNDNFTRFYNVKDLLKQVMDENELPVNDSLGANSIESNRSRDLLASDGLDEEKELKNNNRDSERDVVRDYYDFRGSRLEGSCIGGSGSKVKNIGSQKQVKESKKGFFNELDRGLSLTSRILISIGFIGGLIVSYWKKIMEFLNSFSD